MAYLFLLSRILFGGFFVLNGINHLRHHNDLTGYAASKRVPMPKVSVVATGVLLLISGLSLMLGMYPAWGVLGIVIFLVPTTFMMHDFWKADDPQVRMNQYIQFTKNIALLGAALVYLFIPGPWPFSF